MRDEEKREGRRQKAVGSKSVDAHCLAAYCLLLSLLSSLIPCELLWLRPTKTFRRKGQETSRRRRLNNYQVSRVRCLSRSACCLCSRRRSFLRRSCRSPS